MAITFRDRYKTTLTEAPATSGDFAIGLAAEQFHTFGAQDDGLEFDIVVVDTNDEWEIREFCTYDHANKHLTRGTLVDSSTGGVVNLSASAILAVTLLAKRVPTGQYTGTVTEVTTSAPLHVTNGTTTPALTITKADSTHDGYLSTTDWNTFNGKQDALGFVPYNSTNPAGYTSNLGTVTTVSGNGPLTVTNGSTTPSITLSQSTTSTDGYLSSTDWNTFNAKLSSVPVASATVSGTIKVGTGLSIDGSGVLSSTDVGGTVTEVTATGPLHVTNGTTTPALTIDQASSSTSGYLSSTDWNTFNNKSDGYTLPIASDTVLGGVKVDNITITAAVDGTITAVSAATAGSTSVVRQYVKNGSGVALTKGQAVYITGADGTNVLIGLASNTAESTSSKTLGLLAQDLAVNAMGYVITDGVLSGIDTSTAAIGNPVWLGSTAGTLLYGLANKPVAPNHLVYIGVVSRVNQNNGEILIKVQNGFELDELHNVLTPSASLANNDLLVWESSSSLWKNKQLASGQVTTALGFTPYNATNPAGYTTNVGTVTTVSGNGPLTVSNPSTTPSITIAQANTSTDGYLSSTDWNTFNSKLSSVPVASASVSGTVKVGSGLAIDGSGVLSATSTGSTTFTIVNKSSSYNIVVGDNGKIINFSPSGAGAAANLPDATAVGSGFNVTVWNTSTDTSGLTIQPSLSQTVDGLTSYKVAMGSGVCIISNGTNWELGNVKNLRSYSESITPTPYGDLGVGTRPTATGYNSVAIGRYSKASGQNSLCMMGTQQYGATGLYSIAIGEGASSTATTAYALSQNSVASAGNAISIGTNAQATGSQSISLGYWNKAAGWNSLALGSFSNAVEKGKMVFSSGGFTGAVNYGDAQAGLLVLRGATTDATPKRLTSDQAAAAATNQLNVSTANATVAFTATVVASRKQSESTTACAAWEIKGILRADGTSTVTLVDYNISTISNTTTWNIAVSADNTNKTLAITATGETGANIKWVASINSTELLHF